MLKTSELRWISMNIDLMQLDISFMIVRAIGKSSSLNLDNWENEFSEFYWQDSCNVTRIGQRLTDNHYELGVRELIAIKIGLEEYLKEENEKSFTSCMQEAYKMQELELVF
jgi:hypothetical protein